MASGSDLQISKIKSAGDVIHVFSHIRKTYRVQWVLLEGGGSAPPLLASRPPVTATSQAKGKRKAETTQGKAAVDIIGPQEQPVTTKWVPFDEDMEAKCVSLLSVLWIRNDEFCFRTVFAVLLYSKYGIRPRDFGTADLRDELIWGIVGLIGHHIQQIMFVIRWNACVG